MTSPRRRVLLALGGVKPDKVPKFAWWTPAVLKMFKDKTGSIDPAEYFNIEIREVFPSVVNDGLAPFLQYYEDKNGLDYTASSDYLESLIHWLPAKEIDSNIVVNEWGIGRRQGEYYHYTSFVHPMRNINTVEQLSDYPFPHLNTGQDCKNVVSDLKSNGYYVIGNITSFVFETAWLLRGFENFMMDLSQNQTFTEKLLDRIAGIKKAAAIELVKSGVDQINFGDDIANQLSLTVSPRMWREFIKPYVKDMIKELKNLNPSLSIFYHSDGNIEEIIPDLLEIGIDIINPVQPECMDPEELRREFGQDLTLCGTIGGQTTMLSNPDEIKRVVRSRIEKVGKEGKLVLMPGTDIQPDVPWENIIAFFEAIEEA